MRRRLGQESQGRDAVETGTVSSLGYESRSMRPGAPLALMIGVSAVWVACGSSSGGGSPSAPEGGVPEDAGMDSSSPAPDGQSDSAAQPESGEGGDLGPFPLGATWGTDAVHFRVRADAAAAVEVDVYAASLGADAVAHYPMTRAAAGQPWAADVTHEALAAVGITSVVYYGYRAWGPNWTVDPTWTEGSSAGFVDDVDDQ
jgi:glycogen operon protein